MADLTVLEPESEISSVRSNVSDASSGYALVSGPMKKRNALKDIYPHEPPPDYDQKQSPIKYNVNSSTPLLVQPELSPTKLTHETSQPLLTPGRNPDQVSVSELPPRTIVRINSRDVNIEIVSDAQSPNSVTTDTSFFPRQQRQGCCKCSKSTKIKLLFVLLMVVMVALILVLINFLVCIGSFTTACKT